VDLKRIIGHGNPNPGTEAELELNLFADDHEVLAGLARETGKDTR
jgi:hypothetical protein